MPDPATPTPTTPSPATPAPAATPQTPAAQPASTPAGQTQPQPTPGAPAAPAAPEGPKEPQSAAEAKRALQRGQPRFPSTIAEAKQALAKGEHHAQTQPRAEDGKFTAPATEPSAATAPDPNAPAAPAPDATPPAEGAAPAPSAEPAAPTAATDAVPEGMVRIDIPEGHALRHRGDHYLAPKEFEDINRWAINNTIRHEHVSQWERHAKGLEGQVNRLKAELEATREFTGGIFTDPAVIAQAEDIGQTYGEEAKKRFLAGIWQEQQAKVDEITAKQQAEAVQAQEQEQVSNFIQQAYSAAQKRYPEWSQQEFKNALAAYGSWVQARGANELKLNEFLQHADPVYLQNPRARAAVQARADARREQERTAAAKAEADRLAAEERKKLEEAAARRAQYPWMGVPATAVPAQVGIDDGAGGPRTVHDAKRALRRRNRTAATQ